MIRFLFYPLAIAAAIIVVVDALDAERLITAASLRLNLEANTELAWKSALEKLTFSWYSGASDARETVQAIYKEADLRAERAAIIAAGLAIATIAHLLVIYYLRKRYRFDFIGHLLGTATICLSVGVMAPVLNFKAFADLPVLGTVILKYEAKTILSTIGTLIDSGNVIIGILVALFSLVTPAAKLVLGASIIQGWWPTLHNRALHILKLIGKWSMADVFTVSILLAFFALRSDEFSEANLGLGLYFFAAYCLLSQWASHLLVNQAQPTPVEPD